MELKPNGKAGLTEAEWLEWLRPARSDGSYDENFDKIRLRTAGALRTAREQAIAEHGILKHKTAFKDEQGNQKPVIEVDLDRVELGDLLSHAERDYATQREKLMSPDGQNVNVIDDSDPETHKDLMFERQMKDMAVAGGIVDAIKSHINGQE